jgi:hypothetical protein
VYDATFDHTIPNGLAYDVFRVLLGIKVKLDADVAQGDTRIRERKSSDSGLDDILAEADDEGVCLVNFELCCML